MLRRFSTVCWVMFALLSLAVAQAQDSKDQLVGVGAHTFVAGGIAIPVPVVHYGAEVVPHFRLRGSLTSVIIVNLISADALYVYTVSDAALRRYSGYIGGGPDVLIEFSNNAPLIFVLHATAGGEFHTGDLVGLFAEIQPFVAFDDGYIASGGGDLTGLRFQIGVNFHF